MQYRAGQQRRANTGMNYLISKGVSADKLTAKGYGPDIPLENTISAEGMAANRRVELYLSSMDHEAFKPQGELCCSPGFFLNETTVLFACHD